MILKKLFIITLFLLCVIPGVNAYTSNEAITLFIESPDVWTSLYTVPDGKDLVINRIYINSTNEVISLRNSNWATLYSRTWKEEYTGGFIVIYDDLQVLSDPAINSKINLFWYLVNEEDDVEGFIEWNSNAWSKNIFTKDFIKELYLYESIIMLFIILFTFFLRLLWYKRKKKMIFSKF